MNELTTEAHHQPYFILASASTARQHILQQSGLRFKTQPSSIDETIAPDETPQQLVRRLAISKASKVALTEQEHWVIGADQILIHHGHIYGKPHNQPTAIKWLQQFSGQPVSLLGGLCLYHQQLGHHYLSFTTQIQMRALQTDWIKRYAMIPAIWQCAGGMMLEAYGGWLVESMTGGELGAYQGLSILALHQLIEQAGIYLLDYWI